MAERQLIENLPMYLNLGDWPAAAHAVIGYASAFRDEETGTSRIEIALTPENSDILEHLQSIAELKAIGFAGIMRRPDEGYMWVQVERTASRTAAKQEGDR